MRDVSQQLERWRAQGADRLDPVGFARLAALATRTQAQTGATRALLDARLETLLAEYRVRVDQARARKRNVSKPTAGKAGPLAGLLDALQAGAQQRSFAREDTRAASPPPQTQKAPRHAAAEATHAAAVAPPSRHTPAYPQLPALDEFQRLWEEVRSARQLRQSLEPAPEDAGPLNSHLLVHRALTLMHDTAPDYLRHFLGYVDALSWLMQLQGGSEGELETPRMAQGAKPGKPARSRARRKTA